MAYGNYEGAGVEDAAVRNMFTRETVLASDWYKKRLQVKQDRDVALWRRHVEAVDQPETRKQLERVSSPAYIDELVGTIGADPFEGQIVSV